MHEIHTPVIPCLTLSLPRTAIRGNPVTISNTCQLAGFSIAYQFFLIKTLDTDFRRYDGNIGAAK